MERKSSYYYKKIRMETEEVLTQLQNKRINLPGISRVLCGNDLLNSTSENSSNTEPDETIQNSGWATSNSSSVNSDVEQPPFVPERDLTKFLSVS